jgi:tRNA(Arg) A34 adenosine deaminase TadA
MPVECCSGSSECDWESVWEVRQVFSEDHYRDCSNLTIEFWCISGLVPVHIESVVSTIGKHFPLNMEYNYLKRIHSGTVLICPYGGSEDENEKLDNLLVSLASRNLVSEKTKIEKIFVPKYPVLTKTQYEAANKIWPVRVTIPLVYTDHQLGTIQTEKILNKLKFLSSTGGSCLIESPDRSISVIGKGADPQSPSHFRHAVLDAADQVGKISDYLATDFSVYLLGEPCIMCSMALLHSRVKEVYFLYDEKGDHGFHGFGSTVSVHCQKKLNHRFDVFRVQRKK